MPTSLRCVFYDPDVVDTGTRLSGLAFEACARVGAAVFAADDVAAQMLEHGLAPEECMAVGASLAEAPVGSVWVSPLDLDVRGPTVRVAEEGEELLYEAVIAELAMRRSA